MSSNPYKLKIPFGAKELEIEIGRVAKQASGSALVRLGETVLLVTAAVASEVKEGQDFFPLTVDYRERTYAAGKIPGGFFKRETRPRENEILTSRLVDRSIRPLFPEGFRNAVQVNVLVLSCDQDNDTDIASIVGASAVVCVSQVPFNGPLGAVRVGLIDGNFVINPTNAEQKNSTLDLVVAGSPKGLIMIESGASEVSEEKILEALEVAQKEILAICAALAPLIKECGKEKMSFEAPKADPKMKKAVEESVRPKIRELIRTPDKAKRENAFSEVKTAMIQSLSETYPEQELMMGQIIEDVLYVESRALVLNEKVRTDGRAWDQIRPIACEVGVLPRTHGSSLFTRGQTQALVTVTLGTPDDMQIMDELKGEYKERFMLHYNFPGFATGEARGDRTPGRREIGHGALARRSLLPLLPTSEEFPYTLRVVSEILESNGSSSMASVCGGSLALLDAGVPVKSTCAGIAMGLITDFKNEGGKKYAILSDIIGMEDHLGDMDFKVAGSSKGITALQMDVKIEGVTLEILREAVAQAKKGREHIMGKMNAVLAEHRADLSAFAPKMIVVTIPVEKIGALIGPGGKNIRKIIEESGAEVNVDDDGKVSISSSDSAAVEKAKDMVESTVAEVEIGKVYKGKVTRLMSFGAFVEVLPGKEGLVHISQIDVARVEKVEDVLKEGDEITVKCIEIDAQGRVNLSRKALLPGGEEQGGEYSPRPRPSRPPFSRDRGKFRK